MNATAPVTLRELSTPEALAAVDDLELLAHGVVEGFLHGLHRSPYIGFSVDFACHREYIPGDDLRHLNWKLFARHDRLYIKQYDAETNVDLHLVVDVSGSMTVGTGAESKRRHAALLAASLAHLAGKQRDAVGLTLFAKQVVEHYPARGNLDHRLSLLAALARPRPHPRADTVRALHEVAELLPRRGLVVLISDLYCDTEELWPALDHFRHVGHDLLVLQVLTPLERRMPADGAVKLVDAETGEPVETLAHEIRESYTRAVDDWLTELHHGCAARGIDHRQFTTDEPLERALADYCWKRSQLQ
jgi:uncharacterized protein (DUF58 family)